MKAITWLTRPRWNCSLSLPPLAVFCGLVGVVLVTAPADANPWVPIANPMTALPNNLVPGPQVVPGKDFSDVRDRNAAGAPDPERVVAWDGSGGVRDSFDYSGTRPTPLFQDMEVDGLAAPGDALFQAVRDNHAALLFSVETDPNIMFERETGLPASPPGFGVWATALDIDAMNPPLDTDALEIWGDDNKDDSERYSIAGDPFLVGTGKVAVWNFTPLVGPSAPHTLTTDLAAAMDLQFAGIGVGGPYWSQLVELMDVDAIMMFGPQVTFSIRPITINVGTVAPLLVTFDGGEIFEYDGPGIPTRFLDHGGHLWDTAFDVRGAFLVNNENIDALEAASGVPEPSCVALLLLGIVTSLQIVSRRR